MLGCVLICQVFLKERGLKTERDSQKVAICKERDLERKQTADALISDFKSPGL